MLPKYSHLHLSVIRAAAHAPTLCSSLLAGRLPAALALLHRAERAGPALGGRLRPRVRPSARRAGDVLPGAYIRRSRRSAGRGGLRSGSGRPAGGCVRLPPAAGRPGRARLPCAEVLLVLRCCSSFGAARARLRLDVQPPARPRRRSRRVAPRRASCTSDCRRSRCPSRRTWRTLVRPERAAEARAFSAGKGEAQARCPSWAKAVGPADGGRGRRPDAVPE